MFEYAISCGEGTLLEDGMCNGGELAGKIGTTPDREYDIRIDPIYADYNREWCEVSFRPASPDCQTGK